MTDPNAVARALARLADGAPRHDRRTDHRHPEGVVADAETAMGELTDAAAFVDADEGALRRAVRTAEQRGDDDLTARGRAVLTRLSAFREAADGEGDRSGSDHPGHGAADRPPSDGRTTSTPLAQRSSREGS